MKKLKLLIFLLLIMIPVSIFADAGPKPSLEIIVEGMENDSYWLDLLVQDEAEYSWLDITPEEKERVKKLAEYKDEDGFHPALLGGTHVPLSGKLKGEVLSEGTYSHKFSYVGTPEEFKIAILTEENELIVSSMITREHFNSRVIFDVSTLEAKEVLPFKSMFFEFNLRLILTLTIEFLAAILFGFSIKKYWKVLLKVNIFTQVLLNIGVLAGNLYGGLFMAIFIFIVLEVFILVFETTIYARILTDKPRFRRIFYGITANLLSLAAGFYVNILGM